MVHAKRLPRKLQLAITILIDYPDWGNIIVQFVYVKRAKDARQFLVSLKMLFPMWLF